MLDRIEPPGVGADDQLSVGEAAAAYAANPPIDGSAATHVQASPSADDQIPPRQLSVPDGPVPRKPPGTAATLNSWP